MNDWQNVLKRKKDPRLKRAGGSGFNTKLIRFGEQGAKTNQSAKQRKAFKSRHAKNIKRGKLSAAYWADKVKWSPKKTKSKSKKWKKGS